ncbi:uncharacterized protein KY384_005745 [Bacidia gigantensis]|uniref:uncharacterized protein n=1 Tax=Bacidia gigantensis TaxID=2732470 RepID=UPI001D043F28|nr:uncharacterized protein KY384_005745 [Bacidia gigantensis]KAG8529110.1 hypothetical protein KY384_005745 [Bacidia gigantensis]
MNPYASPARVKRGTKEREHHIYKEKDEKNFRCREFFETGSGGGPEVSRCQRAPKRIVGGARCIETQEYDIAHIARILEGFGHELDPCGTDLYPQVVHVALPVQISPSNQSETFWTTGDLFVFPSGTIVAWDIPDATLESLVSGALRPAATAPLSKVEEEDLEYVEDANRENSSIKGDRIVLGTKPQPAQARSDLQAGDGKNNKVPTYSEAVNTTPSRTLDTVLAKIAFSSGLARSTKLAVLESLLSNYFESTRSIPEVLSRGGRLPFTRSFILQKTGQLLSIRAQLNLYSELTDSLPDLFWDSRHELGLEGYYDQVGKALDTNIRIKVLNEKMDYAQEIASVLRQQLSEKHGVRLEWIIILLIAVEVVFAIDKEVKEYRERSVR